MAGFVEGKSAQGRKRETYLTYLQRRKVMTPMEPIRFAYERYVWFGLSKAYVGKIRHMMMMTTPVYD